jgi:hypothetical protein
MLYFGQGSSSGGLVQKLVVHGEKGNYPYIFFPGRNLFETIHFHIKTKKKKKKTNKQTNNYFPSFHFKKNNFPFFFSIFVLDIFFTNLLSV